MRPRTLLLLAAMILVPVLLGYLVFFGAPLGLLGLQSVHTHRGAAGLSVEDVLPLSYGRVLASPLYRRLLGQTFRLAAACALVCLLAGYPLAWALRLGVDRLRASAALGRFAPTLVTVLLRGMGALVVLGEFGLINLVLRTLRVEADLARRAPLAGELGELSSMVQVFFPFMVLALYGAVATMGGVKVRALSEAAYAESATLVDWQLGAVVLAVVLIAAAVLLRLLFAALRRADGAS